MIDIYTEKKNSKNWILKNDLYFNLNTANEEMSEKEVKLIQQVDEARLTTDKHIETNMDWEQFAICHQAVRRCLILSSIRTK